VHLLPWDDKKWHSRTWNEVKRSLQQGIKIELYYILIRPSQPIICAGDVMYCSCVCCLCIVTRFLEHSDTSIYFWTCLTEWESVTILRIELCHCKPLVQLRNCLAGCCVGISKNSTIFSRVLSTIFTTTTLQSYCIISKNSYTIKDTSPISMKYLVIYVL